MKTKILIYIIFLVIAGLSSCRKDEHLPEPTALGTVTVNLNAKERIVRKTEALIGNLCSDAIKENVESKGKIIDFAVENGGSIRYNKTTRSNGIYPAGIITAEMVDEMLPFGDATVIVRLTGKELKDVFERSVAQYSLSKGPFLQLSKGVQVTIDTNQSPQVININETAIVSRGNRIRSVKIRTFEIDSNTVYSVAFPSFMAEGNDGYVTLKNIASELKDNLEENQANALKEYIILHSPVTPVIEDRMVFQ
jgi:5'-nucleotidase / UDP-sugar diphosphatase